MQRQKTSYGETHKVSIASRISGPSQIANNPPRCSWPVGMRRPNCIQERGSRWSRVALIPLKRWFEFDDLGDQIAECLVGIDVDDCRSRKGAVELTHVRERMADVAVKDLF